MGQQSEIKALRKQVRNVTQELLPALLQTEVFSELESRLTKILGEQMSENLTKLRSDIESTLKNIDERSKDVQAFIMNRVQEEMAKGTVPMPEGEQTAESSLEPIAEESSKESGV